jgi:hypothetical protein
VAKQIQQLDTGAERIAYIQAIYYLFILGIPQVSQKVCTFGPFSCLRISKNPAGNYGPIKIIIFEG